MKINLNNPLIKGAIIIILTSVMSIATNLPNTSTQWLMFFAVTGGTLAGYFAQSALFPSTSEAGQIDGKDLFKAALVALSNGLSTWGATLVEGQPVKWGALGVSMVGLFLGYILKQYKTDVPK